VEGRAVSVSVRHCPTQTPQAEIFEKSGYIKGVMRDISQMAEAGIMRSPIFDKTLKPVGFGGNWWVPVGFGGSTWKNFPHNQVSKSLIGYVWLGLVSFSYVWLTLQLHSLCDLLIGQSGTKRNEFRSKSELPLVHNNQTAITKTGCVWLCSVAFGCVWLFAAAPV